MNLMLLIKSGFNRKRNFNSSMIIKSLVSYRIGFNRLSRQTSNSLTIQPITRKFKLYNNNDIIEKSHSYSVK